MKHLLTSLLADVLEARKYTYRSLGTYVWEEKISKKIIKHFPAETYVEDITNKDVVKFFNSVRFKNTGGLISTQYLKSLKTIFRAIITNAIMEDYIIKDPMFGFKLPTGKECVSTERIISEEDLCQLIDAIKDNTRFRIIVPILLLTGLRIGELLALKWSDINMENQIIHVKNSVSQKYVERDGKIVREGPVIGLTKTASSVRELPVSEQVMVLLSLWQEYLDSLPGIAAKQKVNRTIDVIFVNNNGNIMNYNTLYKQLVELLDKHHLKHCGILFHKFRHCYATHLLNCGVDIDIISKLLGHANIVTTANTYVKVNIAPKIEAVRKHEEYILEHFDI